MIEVLFAHLKRILRLDRLRLRGPSGARDAFLLAATAQNLRKLAKLTRVLRCNPPNHNTVHARLPLGSLRTVGRFVLGKFGFETDAAIGRIVYGLLATP